jgi:predicted nucleic acid-binding protein
LLGGTTLRLDVGQGSHAERIWARAPRAGRVGCHQRLVVANKDIGMDTSNIIADTSVLVDLFVTEEARHDAAARLADWLVSKDIRLRLPMHAVFEIQAAVKNKQMQSPSQRVEFWNGMLEHNPFWLDLVPIDAAFVGTHIGIDLPYLKGADLIFVSMAKQERAILITEDGTQAEVAKKAGVPTYRVEEFLRQFGDS